MLHYGIVTLSPVDLVDTAAGELWQPDGSLLDLDPDDNGLSEGEAIKILGLTWAVALDTSPDDVEAGLSVRDVPGWRVVATRRLGDDAMALVEYSHRGMYVIDNGEPI